MSPSPGGLVRGAARGLGRGAWRVWRAVQAFLDVIGLHESRGVRQASRLAGFRLRHMEFRKLLSANDAFLATVADIEGKLHGGECFDLSFVRAAIVRAVAAIHRMVEGLLAISDGRYGTLRPALDRVTLAVREAAGVSAPEAAGALILDLADTSAARLDQVGGKMANLGEARNVLGLPVPDGFTVTVDAYRLLIEESRLHPLVAGEHVGVETEPDACRVGDKLTAALRDAPMPARLAAEIGAAYDRLARRLGVPPAVAVRSSALGEDGRHSFAGQYTTLLNIDRDGLVDAYREVVSSLYSPEVMSYRLHHGIPGETAAMAVGIIAMVPARTSGVAFSRDPSRADRDEVLIQAVRGLGVTITDGGTSADEARVSAAAGGGALVLRGPTGVERDRPAGETSAGQAPPPVAAAESSCITDTHATQIAAWARRLEAHFACPQDLEWATDDAGKLVLLQSRPLRILDQAAHEAEPVAGARVLLRGGEAACPGAGTGPAVRLDEDGDLDSFPAGAVLVARRSSPRFVRLLSRASAVVTDAGSTTGHMASLAREYGVPALLSLREATRVITPGTVVTVDATAGFVYAGAVTVPKPAGRNHVLTRRRARGSRSTPAFELLERAAAHIVPLQLTDPRSRSFAPEGCLTLHDLARFVHEKSYEEMFRMGERLGDLRSTSYYLDVFLPIELYVLDLGGGVEGEPSARRIKPAQVRSAPFAALLRGMVDPRLQRFGPRPLDVKGMLDVMLRHAVTSPEQERTFRDPCYAMVSDAYLNYTARVGYHFSVVDTYCCHNRNRNYISVHFKGGAADPVRRGRRVRAIAGILRESGFGADVHEDIVTARISKTTLATTEQQLEMIGRLFQYFRQMDVAMTTDESVERIQQAFLSDRFDFSG